MRSPPRPGGGGLATAGVLNVVTGRFDPLAAPGPIPDSAPRARRLRTPGCSERRGWLALHHRPATCAAAQVRRATRAPARPGPLPTSARARRQPLIRRTTFRLPCRMPGYAIARCTMLGALRAMSPRAHDTAPVVHVLLFLT